MRNRLLICDLDNTLYDWVGYFVSAFYAMVDEVVVATGCDREELLDDFREVHRKHHDSEHPFALLETTTIRKLFPSHSRREVAEQLDRAFHKFNTARKQNLQLYPQVHETLDILVKSGFVLVAHTESKLFAVVDRLNRLKLTKYFQRIYCRERPVTIHPDPEAGNRWWDEFMIQNVVELSHHQRKPDADVVLEICRGENVPPSNAAYVGDSITRDILMAKEAGITSIWAKYGTFVDDEKYRKLVRISHWSESDIEREGVLQKRAATVVADHVLENGFDEILIALQMGSRKSIGVG